MLDQKQETLRLFWLCEKTGKRIPAGVAFYNESENDYRLKIDTMPDDKIIFLKAIGVMQEQIRFRVEIGVRKLGKVVHRAEIGTGSANVTDGYPVFMEIGPFSKTLVMEKSH